MLVALGPVLAFRAATGRGPGDGERVAHAGEDYLLLLHEPAGFVDPTDPREHAAIVERYSRWATVLGERCHGGDELEPGGLELRARGAEPTPSPAGERIGGYFLLSVRDRAEALELARTCPHLEQGGWVELRRIARSDTDEDH